MPQPTKWGPSIIFFSNETIVCENEENVPLNIFSFVLHKNKISHLEYI